MSTWFVRLVVFLSICLELSAVKANITLFESPAESIIVLQNVFLRSEHIFRVMDIFIRSTKWKLPKSQQCEWWKVLHKEICCMKISCQGHKSWKTHQQYWFQLWLVLPRVLIVISALPRNWRKSKTFQRELFQIGIPSLSLQKKLFHKNLTWTLLLPNSINIKYWHTSKIKIKCQSLYPIDHNKK